MACILIIDDDEAVRSATEIVLNVNGFDVVAVANAKLGIEAIKERHIDAVIIDLFMPGMDGLEATKAIRKLSSSVPIIAASGFLFGGTRVRKCRTSKTWRQKLGRPRRCTSRFGLRYSCKQFKTRLASPRRSR